MIRRMNEILADVLTWQPLVYLGTALVGFLEWSAQ